MKKEYITPECTSTALSFEINLLTSNQLPASKNEKFEDDGEFDWGDTI